MSTLSQFFLSPKLTVGETTPDGRTCIEGGWYVCRSNGGVAWIVAPEEAEVSRCWELRDEANTVAQSVTGCTGWFVPTCAQFIPLGVRCYDYWDSYSTAAYYVSGDVGQYINLPNGGGGSGAAGSTTIRCVRSFRCVTF